MRRTWPRGSEWRKWDLHLHAPGTKLSDGFGVDNGDVWNEYCRRLQESDVQVFGITDYFSADAYVMRLALVTATTEGMVNHTRLRKISTDHPTDISKMLSRLVKDGLLLSEGVGRGMVYFVPWQQSARASLFDIEPSGSLPPESGPIPPDLRRASPEVRETAQEVNVETRDAGDILQLEWSEISPAEQHTLSDLATAVNNRPRFTAEILRATVLRLCTGRFLGLRVLAQLLNRNPDDLRKRTLTPMVDEKLLKQAFQSSNDPRQAYTANATAQNNDTAE